MTPSTATSPLADRLDAGLLRRLEQRAAEGPSTRPGLRGAAVLCVAAGAVSEIAGFCAFWGLQVRTSPTAHADRVVLCVDGPALAIEGLADIAARRAF